MSAIWKFDVIEDKHDVYRSELREKVLWIIKRVLIEDEELWKEENSTIDKQAGEVVWKDKDLLHWPKKSLNINTIMIEIFCNVKDYCQYTGKYRGIIVIV